MFQPNRHGGLVWYTDGSKINKDSDTGVYGYGTKQKHTFGLGKYNTVFKAEVYAIKEFTAENPDRDYKNRNVHILSGS
jgi:hypothetical protein